MEESRLRARAWGREHGEDSPDIANWAWPESRFNGSTIGRPSSIV
jgi:xylulose-5-phosphate/fructose-6-phosphate phosphoketolase